MCEASDEVFERLRVEMLKAQREEEDAGRCIGRRWVCQSLDYRAMKSLKERGPERDSHDWQKLFGEEDVAHRLYFFLYPEDRDDHGSAGEFWQGVADDDPCPSPAFASGFAQGVLCVLDELHVRHARSFDV